MSGVLREKLANPPVRGTVITECAQLVDAQVRAKGLVIRGSYAAVKSLKKDFVPDVINALLDEWLDELEPHYAKWQAAPQLSFADYLGARADEVAGDLLKVTDRRAARTSHTAAKKVYDKLRDTAKRHVVEAVPELARLLQRHVG